MAIVAGVDFGTLSVRVSIVDSERGLRASAIADVPVPPEARRSGIRHTVARRSHACAVKQAGVHGAQIEAITLAEATRNAAALFGIMSPLTNTRNPLQSENPAHGLR